MCLCVFSNCGSWVMQAVLGIAGQWLPESPDPPLSPALSQATHWASTSLHGWGQHTPLRTKKQHGPWMLAGGSLLWLLFTVANHSFLWPPKSLILGSCRCLLCLSRHVPVRGAGRGGLFGVAGSGRRSVWERKHAPTHGFLDHPPHFWSLLVAVSRQWGLSTPYQCGTLSDLDGLC